jgi:hypothetical protein
MKNGVKGETISHSSSGDEFVRQCKAIAWRVRYLAHDKQPPSTQLCRFFQDSVTKHVTPTDIRTALRQSLAALGPGNLGIKPDKLEARSLRAGGATALHCATVDPNSIQLFGRWKSHDSIPPYSGKTACSTIRKTNVLQRSIFLLQGGVFVALQPNNYQTFAIVVYPATPFPSMDLWVTRTKIERLTAGIVEW